MADANVSPSNAQATAPATSATVYAWDLPTRLAKWTLAALVGLAFASKYYGDVALVWHMWNGLAILTILVFRILWGLVGGTTARFSRFLAGPGRIVRYAGSLLRGKPQHFLGHNPLGGWMVVALLLLVAAQGMSGLFTTDDIIVDGPLVRIASDAVIERASVLHQQVYWILLGFIAVHVVANIAYSLFGSDNLVLAMIIGRKPKAVYADDATVAQASPLKAIACLILAAAIVFGGIAAMGGRPFP